MAEKKPGSQIVPRTSVSENIITSKGLKGKQAAALEQAKALEAGMGQWEPQIASQTDAVAKLKEKLSGMDKGTPGDQQDVYYRNASKELMDAQAQLDSLRGQQSSQMKQIQDLRAKSSDVSNFLSGTEKEMFKGAQFAEGLLGPEGLGRLGEDAEVQDVLQRYKDISEQGLSRAEVEAKRTQAFEGIDRNTQTAERQLLATLSRAGVKGAVAGQQLLQNQAAGLQQKAGVERDLFLESEALQRQGLQDYSQRLGDVKTFDLSQAAAEKDIALQTGLSFAQIKNAKDIAQVQARAAEAAAAAQRASAAAQACFHGSTLVKMVDGSFKPITELVLGEETSTGEIIGLSRYLVDGEDLVSVDGNVMTSQHIIYKKKKFVLAGTVGNKAGYKGKQVVYDLVILGTHLIELDNGLLATDQEGMEYDQEAIAEFLNISLKEESDELAERIRERAV